MENNDESWWNQRASIKKILIASLVLCGFLAMALMSLIVVAFNQGSGLDDVCLTQTCIAESSNLLSQMNLTADPCEDFYEFACGNFQKETEIPDDKSQVTVFSLTEDKLKKQLKFILEEAAQDTEIEPFKNAKKLYKACTDTVSIEKLGTSPVQRVLDVMGGWPVVVGDKWNQPDKWTWQQATAKLYNCDHLINYLVKFEVAIDGKNTTRRIIELDQPNLILTRNVLIQKLEDRSVQAYHSFQVDLAVLFGATQARSQHEMKAALDFEISLAEISLSIEEQHDIEKLYNLRTIEQVQTDYPYNDWLSYFNSILPAESQLLVNDSVYVGLLSLFEKLGDLLEKTPKRVIANYLAWRIAYKSVFYLPESFRKRRLEYKKATSGKSQLSPRWFECVNIVFALYSHAVGALYVRKHFKKESKENVLEMVNNIKAELINTFSESTWMDEMTKREALKKAKAIDALIGFADEYMDDQEILKYYEKSPATMTEEQYYESSMRVEFSQIVGQNKRLKEPVVKEWSLLSSPANVNADYYRNKNIINFPAGILQETFFNADRPQYMNYGGIGFVIGHEMLHGFDDQGSQFDDKGNLRNWWTNETRNIFLKKAQCLVNQYGNYTEPITQTNLNGINTQGENIADNGGIMESYRAYVRWAKNNPEKQLPGLNYTPKQMFWLSAGQIWCGVYREIALKHSATTAIHSSPRFRVIGPMSNSKEFAIDFKCSATSKMNLKDKCEVW